MSCCEGSWIDCINPFQKKFLQTFFRHIPNCKHFAQNDVAKICPTCWGEAQIINGSLKSAPRGNRQNSWIDHLTKSKPEKDSL